MNTWSSFKERPPKWGDLEVQSIPPTFRDGEIKWPEVAEKPNFLPYDTNHYIGGEDVNLVSLDSGISSGDYKLINNFYHGWHVITLGNNRSDSSYGVQLAFSDTEDSFIFRRKTAAVWLPWKRISMISL